MESPPVILGIESSCDESALALFDPESGTFHEWLHSQIELHREFGGVVPDLASREHLSNFPPLIRLLHRRLEGQSIAQVAVTCGPGLAGCLAIGVSLAKSLALSFEATLTGVNHLRAHAFSTFIRFYREEPATFHDRLREHLPHLGLIVSGGNTLLFQIDPEGSIAIVAHTVDDAAGEALDKGAKLLGLGYPGGPRVEELARKGDTAAFPFPRAFLDSDEPKFSFSGLKTSLRYRLEGMSDDDLQSSLFDLCASYQEAVIDALIGKIRQFLVRERYSSLGLSGGVANNLRLREGIRELASGTGLPLFCAEPGHTVDNASMVAFAAVVDYHGTLIEADSSLSIYPSLTLENAR